METRAWIPCIVYKIISTDGGKKKAIPNKTLKFTEMLLTLDQIKVKHLVFFWHKSPGQKDRACIDGKRSKRRS